MVILEILALWFGVPAWFVGGFFGLLIFFIALIVIGKLQFEAPAPTLVLFGLIVLFMSIFLWPMWVPLLVGIIVFMSFVEKRLMTTWHATGG